MKFSSLVRLTDIDICLSLRGAKRLRGRAEANLEIPHFVRNRLRNLPFWGGKRDCFPPRFARGRNDKCKGTSASPADRNDRSNFAQ